MEQNHILDQVCAVSEQPLGTRVTLGRCMFSLVFSTAWILGSSAYALVCLGQGNKLQALMFTVVVVAQALSLPAQWKQYLLVRSGAVVFMRRDQLRMPTAVSAVVAGLLTLLVSLVTVISVVILQTPLLRHDFLMGLILTIAVNGLLWGFVAYCWYRIHQERLQSKPQEVLAVPTEGVWPPPPMPRS